jgi:hypothetical protein
LRFASIFTPYTSLSRSLIFQHQSISLLWERTKYPQECIMACENASANPSFLSRIDKKIQPMYYQYSVTLPIYGLTPGEKIVLNSLVILLISLFLRLVLFFLAGGINALIALSRDQLFVCSFLICSGLFVRTFVYGPRRGIYGLNKAQRGVLAGSRVQGSGKQH